MKKKNSLSKKIYIYELMSFLLVITFLWLNELMDLPHYLFSATATPINWQESLFETVIIAILGVFIFYITTHFLNHIKYIEGFYHICSYCKKINIDEQWISLDHFLQNHSDIKCSHGLCPECLQTHYGDILNKHTQQQK